MIRPLLTVSGATLLSRVLGFIRDALVAALLGAGPVADAFLAAFQLVNVTRRLLTDTAGGQLLYPSFSWDERWVAFMQRYRADRNGLRGFVRRAARSAPCAHRT
jgi:putative peptidoglycan lipid II flippase